MARLTDGSHFLLVISRSRKVDAHLLGLLHQTFRLALGNCGVRCGRDRAGHHPCKHLALESGTLAPPIGLRHSIHSIKSEEKEHVRVRPWHSLFVESRLRSPLGSHNAEDALTKFLPREKCGLGQMCARAHGHARARVAICTLAMSSAGCTDTMEVSLDADESPALGGQRSAIVCPVCSSAVHLVVSSPAEKSTQVGRGRCRLVTARQGK